MEEKQEQLTQLLQGEPLQVASPGQIVRDMAEGLATARGAGLIGFEQARDVFKQVVESLGFSL